MYEATDAASTARRRLERPRGEAGILCHVSFRTLVAVIGGVLLAVGGVACIVLGLRTHPAVKIDGITLPPKFVRQVGSQGLGHPVQVGRNGWQIAAGCLLIVDGAV